MDHAGRTLLARGWLISAPPALLAAWLAARLAAPASGRLALAGWLLAAANAGAALWLTARSTGRGSRGFLRVGVGGNVLRFLLLIAVLVLLRVCAAERFEPLALSAVAAALVFMAGDVAALVRQAA